MGDCSGKGLNLQSNHTMSDLSKFYERAEKNLQKGKPEAALEAYLAALEQEPRDERAREAAADIYMTLNQQQKAGDLLADLLSDYVEEHNGARAIPIFKRLARTGKPVPETLEKLGQIVEKINRKEAQEAYDLAVRQYHSQGKLTEAVQVLGRLVTLDPRPDTIRRLAETAEKAGDYKTAADAYLNHALTMQKAGFDPSESYERAYELDPENLAACLGYGRVLLNTGRAAEAITLLAPVANYPSAPVEAREPYALALVAAGRTLEAEPFIWDIFERNPQERLQTLIRVIIALVDADLSAKAIALARKLDDFQRKAGKRREFIAQMKELSDASPRPADFLEYMAELYNSANREGDYCRTLIQLFEIYFAEEKFVRAGDALDRAVEVDAYEEGHHERLAMLRGKIDPNRFNVISMRLGTAPMPESQKEETSDVPTQLEDLVLQGEIFLQYSMRAKALECVQRIFKQFPHEEETDERVQRLYANAGFVPRYTDSAPGVSTTTSTTETEPAEEVNDFTLAAEVNRNIARQSNVKSVLSAAVNDIGRNWSASRCIAGLCSPGKPPAAVLEYCAPGVKRSEVTAVVKLIMGMQQVCSGREGLLAIPDVNAAPELTSLRDVLAAQDVRSLLAVPLLDGDEQVGILILGQSGPREWRSGELAVMSTIAGQMVMAINSAKLRSLVRTLAITDEHSGLLKRSSYLDILLSEVRRAVLQESHLTVLLLNFGRASTLVREIGEQGIERMMQEAGQVICSHVRQNDVAIRYDLTEIVLVLADTTERNAMLALEKLRKVLKQVNIPVREQPVTVTGGIAEALLVAEFDPVDIVTEVINRVERALKLSLSEKPGSMLALSAEHVPAAAGTDF